jgi:hypothetical protein
LDYTDGGTVGETDVTVSPALELRKPTAATLFSPTNAAA